MFVLHIHDNQLALNQSKYAYNFYEGYHKANLKLANKWCSKTCAAVLMIQKGFTCRNIKIFLKRSFDRIYPSQSKQWWTSTCHLSFNVDIYNWLQYKTKSKLIDQSTYPYRSALKDSLNLANTTLIWLWPRSPLCYLLFS